MATNASVDGANASGGVVGSIFGTISVVARGDELAGACSSDGDAVENC